MRDLKKQEQSAIEAVARRFSATWEKGSGPHDAYITVAGKRVAVDIATLKRRGTGHDNAAKPRLRFDKVATRVIERLQATVGETMPDGMTVLLTITAPIRLPSKTAASLEDKIKTLLERGSLGRDEKDMIHGNRVHIRLLRGKSERVPRMIAFVHNSDSDPILLLNMTHELLELNSTETGRRASRLVSDRWLIVINAGRVSSLEAYRYIYSQLRMASDFKKILMVFGDGRVGMLTGC
jgi:plasmid stabilization system protein ParE